MTSRYFFSPNTGRGRLPESEEDTKHLEIVWDGREVKLITYEQYLHNDLRQIERKKQGRFPEPSILEKIKNRREGYSPDQSLPTHLIAECQDTLESNSPVMNVITTEIEPNLDTQSPGFPITVSTVVDRASTMIPPMWGWDIVQKSGSINSICSELDILVESEEEKKKTRYPAYYYGTTLYNTRTGFLTPGYHKDVLDRIIAGPLLTDLASKLNNYLTIEIMGKANLALDTNFYDILEKYNKGEYSRANRSKHFGRTYGSGAKIMFHPHVLKIAPDIKQWGIWQSGTNPKNSPFCLNWDMPEPSGDVAEILVGNFSDFMAILKPILIRLEYHESFKTRRSIKAEVEVLSGFWSDVSTGLVKAKVACQ